MKRGLMEWNKVELPQEELAGRIVALRAGMAREGLDAILAYGDNYEAGDLSYLSNFSPYWFDGMLVLTRESDVLLTTLSARIHSWIKGISPVSEVRSTKSLGREAAEWLKERKVERGRIGVTRLDRLPYGVYRAFRDGLPGGEVVDVAALIEALRIAPSHTEVDLLSKAARMSVEAIEYAFEESLQGRKQCEVTAEIEHQLRYSGAEDLLVLIASGKVPGNWPAIATEEKIEGATLVRAICAYKGHWAEVGWTLPGSSKAAQEANVELLARYERAREMMRAGMKVGEVVGKLHESHGKEGVGLGSVAPHTALPDVEGEWSEETIIPRRAVVVLRAGLQTPEGVRAFHSDTFLVDDSGPVRLSAGE